MSNAHGLTKENLLFTFPVGLRENPSIAALGDVTMETLAKRPAEIALLSLYPRIDELPEALLDILAYDFKVDWWDRNYSIEEKRRTLKGNWYVHKHMGTKAAVETALGGVFPGASVSEWFQYDGTPYCFRLDIPLPEEGITEERQNRAISRIRYYKSLRSHLESINIQAESTGFLRVGACTTASMVMEIWPELVSSVEITDKARTGALSTMREAVDIYPELARKVEITGGAGAGALTASKQTVEVFPELTTQVDAEAQAGPSGITATHQTVEIYPE